MDILLPELWLTNQSLLFITEIQELKQLIWILKRLLKLFEVWLNWGFAMERDGDLDLNETYPAKGNLKML